ncbi:MAG: hypothetical protein H7281_17575 [Bacteriovorax sp.]|nr:hypothetical protein [Bacteriovorax sp.]
MKLVNILFFLVLFLSQSLSFAEDSSGSATNNTGINDDLYNQKVFELSAILYGVIEIGGKSCKAAGEKMPSSLDTWWNAVDAYEKGETSLSSSVHQREQDLNQKMQNISDDKTSEKQIDSLQISMDSMDVGIDSISGPNGRIELRQKLLATIADILKINEKENAKNLLAYKKLTENSYTQSLDSAKAACDRRKKVKKCITNDIGDETCNTVDEKDPVPGCDIALAKLPELKAKTIQKYGDIYSMSQVASTELNNKMEALEKIMNETMKSIPHSNDSSFDWSIPMETSIADVTKLRKDSGVKCPNSGGSSDFDRSNLDTIVPEKNSTSSMPNQVASGSDKFLSLIGTAKVSSNVAATFTKSWNIADTVVGQPGQRPAYFNYITDRIKELMAMDESYLARIKTSRTKFTGYISSVKTQLSSGGPGTSGAGSSSPQDNLNNPTKASQFAMTMDSGKLNSLSPAALTNSIGNSLNTGSGSINNTQTKSAGTLSEASTSGKSAAVTLSYGKQADHVSKNTNMVSSNVLSNPDNKIISNSNSALTTHSLSKSAQVLNSENASDRTNKLISDKINNSFQAFSKTEGATAVYKLAANYASNRGELLDFKADTGKTKVGSDKIVVKASVYKNNYQAVILEKTKEKIVKNSSKLKKTTPESETLSQAIKAKKSKNQNAYSSVAEDSLFDVVTKAYIRNYEKVDSSEER